MDDEGDEDESYSDHDLDTLPANAFHQLQDDAFRSTQHQQPDPALSPASKQEARLPTPSRHSKSLGHPSAVKQNRPRTLGLPETSSDYGDFEDEMLDGEIFDAAQPSKVLLQYDRANTATLPGESSQREQWRLQRYGRTTPGTKPALLPQMGPQQSNGAVQPHRPFPPNRGLPLRLSPPIEKEIGTGTVDVDSLQRQVQALLRERDALQRAAKAATDDAFAKGGEIAIVRANAAKAEKEFEGRTKLLQKLHADEGSRQRFEIERTRAELQKVATEKSFLENDLAEGAKQIKYLQQAAKKPVNQGTVSKPGGVSSPTTTPKKSKLAYGDGFEDVEVLPLSPSELALRGGKGGTPKAGAKRKRKANEVSPAKPLQLIQPPRKEPLEGTSAIIDSKDHVSQPPGPQSFQPRSDIRFDFMQKLLRHRAQHDQERTIEALAEFQLPFLQGRTMASVLYDKILVLGIGSPESLPAAVALAVIELWSQCIREKEHGPVHLLIDLVKHILILCPLRTAPELTNSLMELVQETADIIIIPRCQKKPPRSDAAKISSSECLEVIRLMAQDCSIDSDETVRFWRTMRFDFIMMLLSFIHPIDEILATISLLQSSILQKSFAMIIPPGDGKQDATEARVIDNLSRLLVENPRPAQGEPFLDALQICELRLEILNLMSLMCEQPYALEALARHRLVIGRLVRVMNDELDRAYDYGQGHDLRIALVNDATRLLYRLTSTRPDLISMQAKLSAVPGGEKKYLIALTRLAFNEGGGYLEDGIEDDVVELAHQMLEMRVSPEEAEQLVEAFASAPSTRKEIKGSE